MLISREGTLIEPVIVPDTYVCGLHEVEDLGDGIFRFTFFTNESNDRVCAAKIVLSTKAIFHAATWALRAIGIGCCGKFVNRCLH